MRQREAMRLTQSIMSRSRVEGDCLIWQGAHSAAGYGNVRGGEKTYAVHRVVWEWAKGPIKKKEWLRHRCGNRDCVKVDHMYLSRAGRQRKDGI